METLEKSLITVELNSWSLLRITSDEDLSLAFAPRANSDKATVMMKRLLIF